MRQRRFWNLSKKLTIILLNSCINKLYVQLKGENSFMEHENMWKTEKSNLKILSFFHILFVSFWKLPSIWTHFKSAIPSSDSVKALRGRERERATWVYI